MVTPAATVTNGGCMSTLLFDESATVRPPTGATAVRPTVQLAVPFEASDAGEHWRVETAGVTELIEIVPPLPMVVANVPSGYAPTRLPIGIAAEPLAPGATVAVNTATTPLLMMPEFRPDTRQVSAPPAVLQLSDLPEAARAGPGAAEREVMAADGGEMVHCKAAGGLLAADRARDSEMVAPGVVEADDRAKTFWAAAGCAKHTNVTLSDT